MELELYLRFQIVFNFTMDIREVHLRVVFIVVIHATIYYILKAQYRCLK
jgi:hypothetical protein